MDKLTITSTAFAHKGNIPQKYSCDGDDINPPLLIEQIPIETKSIALIMDDPDAPNGTWDHWLKWNIPISMAMVREGMEPEGVAGSGSGGKLTYQGPCPPPTTGEHRYVFQVYALDAEINLPTGASKRELLDAMEGHVLAKGELIGMYSRERL